ncbi:hypothetical protein EDB19DRAFT_2041403 [Suillus lakei]|nr:hypothetical protein EDB19DRAFT_2041403 [Suillus lakei]
MTHQTKMPSSPPVQHLIKRFFKHLDLPKGFTVRSKHPTKNGHTQRSSTATDNEGDVSIPADILTVHPGSLARDPGLEVSTNLSSTRSFGCHVSDMAQTFLPFILAVAGPIPLAGAPVKAAIGGLLEIFQAMDYAAKHPAQLTELHEHCLAYPSVTQDIAACFTNIDRHMADYLVWSQMQIGDDMHKVLVHLGRQEQSLMRIESVFFRGQSSVGPNVTLGFVTLVDATGHLHPIPMGVCDSFEQFNEMLQVLFKHNTIKA